MHLFAPRLDCRKLSAYTLNVSPAADLACACATLRRAERVVTKIYDAELRRAGMRLTQFTLLHALAQSPDVAQKELASMLDVDSTTLTRTLAPLRRDGLVTSTSGPDARRLQIRLTAKGAKELAAAMPHWQRAQLRIMDALGEDGWRDVHTSLAKLTAAGRETSEVFEIERGGVEEAVTDDFVD